MSGVLNVAFADDHKVVTHALRSFFESFRNIHVVGIASSGEELLARISEWTPPDVVVLDLLMPGGMDGTETTRRLLERFPKIRVVALTASTDDARMIDGHASQKFPPQCNMRQIRYLIRGTIAA